MDAFRIGKQLIGDLVSELGISQAAAAGIAGNLAHESGGFSTLQETDPLIEGSRGGFGYAQWTGPRRKAFEEWSASQGLDPSSYEANKGFLVHELTQTPEKRVLASLKNVNSSEDAARVFSDEFLRPGIPHTDKRLEWTKQFDDGGEQMADLTPYEKAKQRLALKSKAKDLLAPQEEEKTTSDRLKDAGQFLLDLNDQVAQGIPFIDEAFYGLERTFGDPVKARNRYQNYNRRLDEFSEENPILSGTANVGGAILSGGAAASALKAAAPNLAGKIANVATSAPKRTAFATGAGGAGVYGAGESTEPIAERGDDFINDALWGGPLGVAGYHVAKGATNAGRAIAEKYGPQISKVQDKISPLFTRQPRGILDDVADDVVNQADDDLLSPVRMAGIVDENDLARLKEGKTIPMTRGDRTQDVRIQRQEQIAAESGSAPMLAARGQQQEAARKPFKRVLGEEPMEDIDLRYIEQDEATKAANILRSKYNSLKSRENAAWKSARETGEGVSLNPAAIQESFVDPVDNLLVQNDYRIGDIPQLDKHLKELREIIGDTGQDAVLSPARLKDLEKWKTRMNNLNFSSETLSPKSAMRLKTLVAREYDNFMTNVGDEAIINGDDKAIKAFKEARKISSERFGFEESDKTIARILNERDLTGEQLVNLMTGTEKLLSKGQDGNLALKMLEYAGDNAPEMRAAMKRGVMAKTFRRGLVKNTADAANPEESMVSFSKMKSEVDNLMSKREIFETIFDDQEQAYFRQFSDDLKLLASKQKGAINNSSTGIWTAEFAQGFGRVFNNPLVRSNPVSGMIGNFGERQAQQYAAQQITGKAEQGLGEFIAQQIDNINAPSAYYGSIGASSLGTEGIGDIIFYNEQNQRSR